MLTKPFQHQIDELNEWYDKSLTKWGILMAEWEMGTGKTRFAIECMERLGKDGKANAALVLCPKSLMSTWVNQLAFHNNLTNVFLWNSSKSKTDKFTYEWNKLLSNPYPVFIVNVEAFQVENEALTKLVSRFCKEYNVVAVFDEITKIKSPKASRTKRIFSNTRDTKYRIGLTGVIAPECILDVYEQYRWLSPNSLIQKSYYAFRSRYALMEDRYVAEGKIVKVYKSPLRMEELNERLCKFTSKVRKEDCLDLPPKIHMELPVELDKEEEKHYKQLKRDLMTVLESGEIISVPAKISLFSKFRQITGGWVTTQDKIAKGPGSKLRRLIEDLEETDESAIIWCEFRHEVQEVTKELRKAFPEARTVAYSGSQSADDNNASKTQFETGQARFFVSDTGMGARGLNLQKHCALQYYYSLTLSTDEYLQAQDRIHRIGQEKTCVYKYLLGQGTVDETVYKLLRNKENMARLFSEGNLKDVIDNV